MASTAASHIKVNPGTAFKPGHTLSSAIGRAVRLYKGKTAPSPQSDPFFHKPDPQLQPNSIYNTTVAANKKAFDELVSALEKDDNALSADKFRETFKRDGISIAPGNEDLLLRAPNFDLFRKHGNKEFVNIVEQLYRTFDKLARESTEKQEQLGSRLLRDFETVAADICDTAAKIHEPLFEIEQLVKEDIERFKKYQDLLPALTGPQLLTLFPRLAEAVQSRWENDEWLLVDDPTFEGAEYYKLDVSPSLYVPGSGGGAH